MSVRPTLAQLLAGTRTGEFRNIDDPMNAECPITRETFAPDDSVLQILQCRHVFSTAAAVRWFDGNTRCPVCRHDVRDPVEAPAPATAAQTTAAQTTAAQATEASSSSAVTPMDLDVPDDDSSASSAARSIAQYLRDSIDAQMREASGTTDSVLIEYGFVVPAGTEGSTAESDGLRQDSDSSSL